ncbi:Bromodomain-containing protein 8 [Bienertia sinuspersici]
MVVVVEEEGGDDRVRWGTWEELILGGAVIRHGSHNWDAVASELQARSIYPSLFTPQACKAKYNLMQKRYSDCSAWIEELRKRRLEELRRELEKSESSIGSLETRLETLKAEKAVCSYGCSTAESSEPLFKSGGNESTGKEASRDGSSAGSFTQETQTNWLPQCHATTAEPSEKGCEKKTESFDPSLRLEKFPSIDKLAETMRLEYGVSIRRRRGKRRRKDLSKDGKEGSVGENNLIYSPDFMTTTSQTKEKMNSGQVKPVISTVSKDENLCTSKEGVDVFMKILDSIMENEHASVFRRRLDSQKRARYKRIVRQHMDLDTIRSRITNNCITSIAELLRDLLLLANNALVFYSKSTREYKCALVLRDRVTKILHQHYKAIGYKVTIIDTPKPPVRKPPAKPRSARPFNCKADKKSVDEIEKKTVDDQDSLPLSKVCSSSTESTATVTATATATKRAQGKRGKVGRVKRGNAGIQAETPMKVRKRGRVK